MKTPTILCVDDERNVLLTLRSELRQHFSDYNIEIAESGAEALALIEVLEGAGVPVPLVIADQVLPDQPAGSFLIELHRRHPQILQIMLAEQTSAAALEQVIDQGNLYRFLSKPWHQIDLQLTVRRALQHYQQEQQIIRQQKQIETALQPSESWLSKAHRVAQISSWEFELATQKISWSEETFRLLGLDPAQHESTYEEFQQKLHSEDRSGLQAAVERAIADGTPYEIELRFLHPDGSIRYLLSRGEAICNAQGQVVKLIGTALDQTSVKLTELALREKEEQFRQLTSHIREIFYVYDLDPYRMVYISPGFEDIWGISGQALEQNPELWVASIHPEDQNRVFQAAEQQRQGHTFREEYRIIRPDGEIRWIDAQSSPIADQDGRFYRIVGIFEDISARKQLEIELRQREAFLNSIYHGVAVAISVIDVELDGSFRYIDFNPVCEQLSGIDVSLLRGKTLDEIAPLLGVTEQEAIQAQFQFCIETGESMSIEAAVTINGQQEWWYGQYSPLQDETGRVYRLIGTSIPITDRKRAEQALQQLNEELEQRVQQRTQDLLDSQAELQAKEQFLRGVFEGTENLVFVIDVLENGSFQYAGWNQATERATGVSSVSTLGKSPQAVFGSKLGALLDRSYRRCWEAGQMIQYEEYFELEPGNIWALVTLTPLRDASGKIHRIVGNALNITERKQAELELQKLAAVVENSTDLIGTASLAGESLYLNAAGQQLVGVTPETLSGMPVTNFLSQEGLFRFEQEAFPQLMQQGYWRGESLFRHLQTGEEITMEQTLFLITDPQTGEPLCMATVSRDIRDRKQAETALQEAQQFAQSIAENAPNIVYLYDLIEQRNLYCNQEIFAFLGYSVEEVQAMGSNFLCSVVHPEDWHIICTCQNEIANSSDGRIFEIEYRIQHRQGNWRWLSDRVAIFKRDETGRVIQYIGTAQDITDRKLLEQELRQINAELEQRVADRTQDLQHAMEAAQAANRAKTIFLSNMSHELRTPLNAILGFSQLLNRNSNLTTTQQEHLTIINRSGEHLLKLINDVLAMSKIEAGRTTLNIAGFDLRDLLKDLENLFRLKAEAKQLNLTMRISPGIPRLIHTDESKLRQVLINLLSNAIKFTTQGSVTLRVGTAEAPVVQTLSDHPTLSPLSLHFEVEDTGCGIEATEQSMVFEPFGQTQSGRNSQEGTGLGLPISRQFVQLMGGELQFTSTPHQGTVFRFTILATAEEAADRPNEQGTAQVIGLATDQPSYRILIVEDNPDNRQFLVQLLSPIGFEVQTAANGQEAINCWQTWFPDLIWMDMRMPVMDGYIATQQIRALEQAQANSALQQQPTKILALTASAFEDERATILAAGCDDFLFKPVIEAALLEKMVQHLGVRYVYQTQVTAPVTATEISEEWLTQHELQRMPSEWISQLQFAARIADEDLSLRVIARLPPDETKLTDALKKLVHEFQFEKLIELTRAAPAQSLGKR